MTAPCLDEAHALAFVAGELAPTIRSTVEAHIDDCDSCRQVLAALVRRGPTSEWVEGHRVGRYIVRGKLGRGGMGTVFRAEDLELGRPVALKRLHAGSDADTRARLVREARAAAQLAHPNVVGVYEVGDDAGTPFIAMELVDGVTLTAWVAQAERTWREITAMFAQAGRGLAAAHERGLVHRDFKPDNVLVDRSGRARVADFGLARAWDGERASGGSGEDARLARLTATGVVSGTPAYMAPELVDGAAPSATSDQYAFAVALHEALRGQHPFAGSTPSALWTEMAAGRIRTGGRAIPAWLERAVRRGLAVDPALRWTSVGSFVDAIARPPRRVWPWLAGAGAVAVASLVVAIVALVSARAPAESPAPGDMVLPMKRLLSNATLHLTDDDHVAAFAVAEMGLVADPTNAWALSLVADQACWIQLPSVARILTPSLTAPVRAQVADTCRRQAPQAPAPAVRPIALQSPRPAPAPSPPPHAAKTPAAKALTDELQNIAMDYHDDPDASLARVERIVAKHPDNAFARRVAVMIGCDVAYKQQREQAAAAVIAATEAKVRAEAEKLTPYDRWMVWSECQRWSGIWLEGDVERGGKIEHIGPKKP